MRSRCDRLSGTELTGRPQRQSLPIVTWTTPLQAHHDHSPVQHGLASIIANPDGGASILWLEALKGEDNPVSLKRTILDAAGISRAQQRQHPGHRGDSAREQKVVDA
jgi:hypothetical protein